MTCFEAPPKVDSKKLAELGKYKNAASANTCWYNLKNKLLQQNGSVPKVNLKKLAELGKYKNPASANTCWYNLKKKLLSADDVAGNGIKIGARKRTADGSAGGEGATPKKRRGRKTKAAVEEEEALGVKVGTTVEGAEESDDDLEVVTPKREHLTDPRALKLEILREMEAEDEAYQKSKQRDGKVKPETMAEEEEEVSKTFLEQVAEYSADA
ncbi:hypothetical protein LTR85_000813 [Meristemomyces frigidus]|nr:hypothetical protein LTR85_000813 [Meristemomyces frigidus]